LRLLGYRSMRVKLPNRTALTDTHVKRLVQGPGGFERRFVRDERRIVRMSDIESSWRKISSSQMSED
jgi:hypothetical protein